MRRMFLFFAVFFLLAGCESNRTDLVKTGYLSLQPTLTASLAHPPEVYEQDGGLVVNGRLDSAETTRGGHVDVQVVGPDGKVVYDASVSYRRPSATTSSGPRGTARGPRSPADSHATYSVRFPGLPPTGSVVRVQYDAQPHSSEGPK